MFNQVITTLDTYKGNETDGGIIIHKNGEVKEYQKVVAVGPMVKNIEVGDIVYINPSRYAKRKFKEGTLRDDNVQEMNPVIGFEFKIITIDNIDHLRLFDSDIEYIIEDYEEVPDVIAKNSLILPKKKKLKVPDSGLIV